MPFIILSVFTSYSAINSCKCKHAYAIHSIDCTNYILLLSRGDIAVEYDKIGQMRPNWPRTNGGKRRFCYHFTVWDEFIVVAAVFFLSADKIPSIFTNWSDYWLGAIHIISSMHAECAWLYWATQWSLFKLIFAGCQIESYFIRHTHTHTFTHTLKNTLKTFGCGQS